MGERRAALVGAGGLVVQLDREARSRIDSSVLYRTCTYKCARARASARATSARPRRPRRAGAAGSHASARAWSVRASAVACAYAAWSVAVYPVRGMMGLLGRAAAYLLLPLVVAAPKCTNQSAACPHLVTVLADECVIAVSSVEQCLLTEWPSHLTDY